ncbi:MULTISPECIES: YfiR family protein [unclassified Sphingopyxis]|uniref:YfiR family protein n=1 Tax=unclassified Sphingopyxis TaxID=2614943 RepID=UPI0025D84CD3|nr:MULTISPECIES: YfiR family protein [unclassified Sphingopyxis]
MTTPQMSVQAASQTIVEDSDDGMARAVNRMVGGIVSYARWPNGPADSARVMCVVGTPRLTNRMAPDVPGAGSVLVRRLSAAAVMGRSECDILFLGRMAVADRRQLIAWVRGRPILTITDDDAACMYGAMFCLSSRAASLSFSVNLDAIGRGPLRIDPRVLSIGRSVGGSS